MIEAIKAGCSAASATAYEYTKIIDIFVGQAQIMWPWVYGAFKVLLVARVNHTEMKQNVEEHMATSKAKFEIVDHLTTYLPSQRLVQTIGKLYDCFQRFLAKALKFYSSSRLSIKRIQIFCQALDSAKAYCSVNRTDLQRSTGHNSFFESFHRPCCINQGVTNVGPIEGEAVRFSKASDVEQTCQLFRRRVEAKLEKHGVERPHREVKDSGLKSLDLDAHLADPFIDLIIFEEARAQQLKVEEQRPEIPNRLSYSESCGNHFLSRNTFSASFIAPLVLFGESNFEISLVLRHFCGDSHWVKPSNFRALIQSLLMQILKQRGCVADCGSAPYVFVVIGSIDFPAPEKAVGVVEERELIITSFNDLLKQQSTLLTKVLLTASFASDVASTRMSLDALLIRSLISAVRRQPQRQLSVAATIEDEPGPVLHRLVEIQERICRAIQFTLLPMLYPADSPIYTCVYGVLRANWTSELSGMDPRLLGAYSPFIIRAWAIDLNGKALSNASMI
ncbi:hypothetical protein ETB97_006122 [Aspergillus alliaceus]|uniref:DUF7708 domain-containing protein n=1 Tax=Petromyces alliaceus TaxID=209559 RepID=A0A8H6AAE4_PETAA|nr:hypothetical protein ETB97_006122 [Aspergillus burnettii]